MRYLDLDTRAGQVPKPPATLFPTAASHSHSNSLSASSSFSSDFSGTSSFSVPSPVESRPTPNTHSQSSVRSLLPAGPNGSNSVDVCAEIERLKRDMEDHAREYKRKKAGLGSIVTACAQSAIEANGFTA